VKRTPLDIEGVPKWQIVRDLASGTVVVTTGIRSAIQTTNRDGRFEIDRTGRASVSVTRPDDAHVEGEATIRLKTPQGADVTVQSRLRITQDGQDFHASVNVDGQVTFERHWASERFPKTGATASDSVRSDADGRPAVRRQRGAATAKPRS
jgi:hypothetical protein